MKSLHSINLTIKSQKQKTDNSVKELMTQNNILFNLTKNIFTMLEMKSFIFKHVFSKKNMYRQISHLPCLKMNALAGKHVEADLGQLATQNNPLMK